MAFWNSLKSQRLYIRLPAAIETKKCSLSIINVLFIWWLHVYSFFRLHGFLLTATAMDNLLCVSLILVFKNLKALSTEKLLLGPSRNALPLVAWPPIKQLRDTLLLYKYPSYVKKTIQPTNNLFNHFSHCHEFLFFFCFSFILLASSSAIFWRCRLPLQRWSLWKQNIPADKQDLREHCKFL